MFHTAVCFAETQFREVTGRELFGGLQIRLCLSDGMRGGAKDGLGLDRDAGFGFFACVHAPIGGDAKRFRILCIIGKDGDPNAGADLYIHVRLLPWADRAEK